MSKSDLIKTVRNLDKDGPGDDGQNLKNLWKWLSASVDGQYHAAEESTLRWLLKSMNGTTVAAETLRRFPLTWGILGCVFQRIPLFSLAKSLADRKFFSVLQQTFSDISNPAEACELPKTSKRKRTTLESFSLEDLRSTGGSLQSGRATFKALDVLLRRLDSTTTSSHDRIGAEHLRSLFCTASSEAASVVSPALSVCNVVLGSGLAEEGDGEGMETWVKTVSSIWTLHLQGSNDTIDVARHLFPPAAEMISRLERISLDEQDAPLSKNLRKAWSDDVQKLMHRHLIFPARNSFLNRQDMQAVATALEKTTQTIDVLAPALYFFAATATELLVEQGIRKGNPEWMKKLFQMIGESIQGHNERGSIIQAVLKQAKERLMPVDSLDLQSVCEQYALREGSTDWVLMANVALCDPDVFQATDSGHALLKETCQRTLVEDITQEDRVAISEVIEAIIKGFRTARDLSAFLRLWFEQLCEVEKRKLGSHPWTSIGREGRLRSFDHSVVESELSPPQLKELLEWVESSDTQPQALCLWLNAISQGIRTETFQDAVGPKVLDLALSIKDSSSNETALRWRVIARALPWNHSTEPLKCLKDIKKVLKKGPLHSAETYETFKCCSQIWVSLSPEGDQLEDVAKIMETFTGRLIAGAGSFGNDGKVVAPFSEDVDSEYREETGLQQYLNWYLLGSSRLNCLYFGKKGDLPDLLQNVLLDSSIDLSAIEAVWKVLLTNEHCINHLKLVDNLIDRLIASLDASVKAKTQSDELGQLWLRLISSIPTDAITRPQREKIMATLTKQRKSKKNSEPISLEGWKLFLGLATKLLARPTYYKDMQFQNLICIADSISAMVGDDPTTDNEALLELIGRYSLMASATIKQMAENIDERSVAYLSESSDFASRCKDSEHMQPLHLTLLAVLRTQLSQSASCRSHAALGQLLERVELALEGCLASVIGEWVEDKKLFKKADTIINMRLLAAVDVARLEIDLKLKKLKASSLRKLEKRSQDAMEVGDMRGWKIQIFLRRCMAAELEVIRPTTFPRIQNLPLKLRESLLRDYLASITSGMEVEAKSEYLKELVAAYMGGSDTDGQLVAVQYIVEQLIEQLASAEKAGDFELSTVHSNLTQSLLSAPTRENAVHICRILYALLEKRPQAISQWNVESLLDCIAILASSNPEKPSTTTTPFICLCKLVEIIIKKHRLRLEGHYHILLNTVQPLIQNLILHQRTTPGTVSQESKAHAYSRLVTLICEPTAGAVSRSSRRQYNSALDSATDAAKRSAGRYVYLILMHYVKLQLETDVPRSVRDALEPAMNSIFDVTPPEGRKILNDAMDGSGRAILREMFKRYTRFGKWSGV